MGGVDWRLSALFAQSSVEDTATQEFAHERTMSNKKRVMKLSGYVNGKRVRVEELLREIDNLAVLLHQVKLQTDKVEAAADAIGDAILNRLGTRRPTSAGLDRRLEVLKYRSPKRAFEEFHEIGRLAVRPQNSSRDSLD